MKNQKIYKYLPEEEINKFINLNLTEEVIMGYENQILSIMKLRYEKYPTKKNDNEWLDYTNYVCSRRCQRNADET
jgi:hypothetical protein